MEYMENQMDSQIEGAQHQQAEYIKEVDEKIGNFIKEKGYTWTVEGIVKEYREKYVVGYYVSFSARQIIEKFRHELGISTGLKKLSPNDIKEVEAINKHELWYAHTLAGNLDVVPTFTPFNFDDSLEELHNIWGINTVNFRTLEDTLKKYGGKSASDIESIITDEYFKELGFN